MNFHQESTLRADRDQAWIDFVDYDHKYYRPRFYKLKNHNWIDPWKSRAEREEVVARKDELFRIWLDLHFKCVMAEIPPMTNDLFFRWYEEKTVDGIRYRRRH